MDPVAPALALTSAPAIPFAIAPAFGFVGLPAIGAHPWAYPALEVVHIVGVALLLGNLLALELRVWGVARELALPALGRLSLTLALAGFALLVFSGVLLFASAPDEFLGNRSFLIKMGLIQLAGLNAAWFHTRGGLARVDTTARVQTALSLGLWLVVIALGRWIAYT